MQEKARASGKISGKGKSLLAIENAKSAKSKTPR
jgi:hypothetical protein